MGRSVGFRSSGRLRRAYQGVTHHVRMALTPGACHPVLVPHGSYRPEWIARV